MEFTSEQECIPVGYVLPASVAVSIGGVSASGSKGPSPHPLHHTPSPHVPFTTTPPPRRGQTNSCENITLPQTLFASGKKLRKPSVVRIVRIDKARHYHHSTVNSICISDARCLNLFSETV